MLPILFLSTVIPFFLLLKKVGLSLYWSLVPIILPVFYMMFSGFNYHLVLLLSYVSILHFCLPFLALRAWPNTHQLPNPLFFTAPYGFVLTALHALFPVLSLYVILKKFNIQGFWALLGILPFVQIVFLWGLAFRKLPDE